MVARWDIKNVRQLNQTSPTRYLLPSQYSFPKDLGPSTRDKGHRAPGPGHYNIPCGVGKQVCGCAMSALCILTTGTGARAEFVCAGYFISYLSRTNRYLEYDRGLRRTGQYGSLHTTSIGKNSSDIAFSRPVTDLLPCLPTNSSVYA